MTTKLDGALKRELEVGGAVYTLTITPQGLTLVPKGRRKGYELAWDAFVSGDAALATALNASLTVRRAALAAERKPGATNPSNKATNPTNKAANTSNRATGTKNNNRTTGNNKR